MAQENELSFFVNPDQLPPLEGVPYTDINQTYFTPSQFVNDHYMDLIGGEWRVREKTSAAGKRKYTSTVKFGSKASGSREEIETELDFGDFGTTHPDIALYGLATVKKRRFTLPDGVELDHFDDELHGGFWLAEREFPDRDAMAAWQPPDWCSEPNHVLDNRALADPIGRHYGGPALTFESIGEKPWGEILDEINRKYRRCGELVVTVSGFSASGKTTFASYLAELAGRGATTKFASLGKLGPDSDATTVCADNYHIGATALNQRFGEVNHDRQHTYDLARVEHDARQLLAGQPVLAPNYDFATAEPTGELTELAPGDTKIVVIEGLYAYLASKYADFPSYNIFVNTPLYASVLRRMKRDNSQADISSASDPNQRKIGWTQEEALRYLMHTALPTYLSDCEVAESLFDQQRYSAFDAFTKA